LNVETAHKWRSFEVELGSEVGHSDPLREMTHNAGLPPQAAERQLSELSARRVLWRVRFMPDEIGSRAYRTSCPGKRDERLHGQTEGLKCYCTKAATLGS